MKRTLQIHIDANQVTCGKCEHLCVDGSGQHAWCELFHVDPLEYDPAQGLLRCAPCLAAEREAGE